MLKKIFLIAVAVLALMAVVIAMQPDTYQVTRSTEIAAPPAEVFALINDFHKWEAWSPWGKLDPNMKATYSGAPSGTGASYYWIGNDDVGEGTMTITGSQPHQSVTIKLAFLKPFASTAANEFTIAPQRRGLQSGLGHERRE